MNKNIYVVTMGEYSDYHIECIFSDKTKAENYVKYHGGEDSYDIRIEEYELSDDSYKLVTSGYYEVHGDIHINSNCKISDCFVADNRSILVCEPNSKDAIRDFGGDWILYITRSFPEKDIKSKYDLKEKLTHILKDTATMVAHFREEGFDLEDIKKMLGFND